MLAFCSSSMALLLEIKSMLACSSSMALLLEIKEEDGHTNLHDAKGGDVTTGEL